MENVKRNYIMSSLYFKLTSLNVKLMAVQEMGKFAVRVVKCSFAVGKFLRRNNLVAWPRLQ